MNNSETVMSFMNCLLDIKKKYIIGINHIFTLLASHSPRTFLIPNSCKNYGSHYPHLNQRNGPLNTDILLNFCPKSESYMARMCQKKHPIMNVAVAFFKMLALYVLWRAQFLTELHVVFYVD